MWGFYPRWNSRVKTPQSGGFFKDILLISNPVLRASENFTVGKLRSNHKLLSDWIITTNDFRKTIIAKDNVFFIESKGNKIMVCSYFYFKKTNNPRDWAYNLCVFDKKEVNEAGLPAAIQMSSDSLNNKHMDIAAENCNAVLPLLMFLDCVEIQEKTIKAKTKQKGVSKINRDTNLSDFDVTLINSSYFTKIYVEGGFEVSGHFRLQACGQGLQDRRLIYIQPYVKNGYTRRAGVELNPVF